MNEAARDTKEIATKAALLANIFIDLVAEHDCTPEQVKIALQIIREVCIEHAHTYGAVQ